MVLAELSVRMPPSVEITPPVMVIAPFNDWLAPFRSSRPLGKMVTNAEKRM